jgi:hypothetical protein
MSVRHRFGAVGFAHWRALGWCGALVIVVAIAVVSLAGGALTPASAWADYEQVGTFGSGGEGSALGGGQVADAVDDATGDVYVADGSKHDVLKYDAQGGFLEAWGWGVATGFTSTSFERCGPAVIAAPTCFGAPQPNQGYPGEGPGQFIYPHGVAVDQVTGNVYVLTDRVQGHPDIVQEFSPNGEHLLASFGEQAAFKEPLNVSVGKIHSTRIGGIAVDSSGNVYVADTFGNGAGETRVMVFKPEAGSEYKKYVYAVGGDVATGYVLNWLAVDAVGDLYGAEGNGFHVYKFDVGKPAVPVWSFEAPLGGIEGLAVDPNSGNAFFFNYKTKHFDELDAAGEHVINEFAAVEKQQEVPGLAFNPGLSFGTGRPAGTLYAIDANPLSGGVIFAQPAAFPPLVDEESAVSVGSVSATLTARVNPKGDSTRYRLVFVPEGVSYRASHPDEVQSVAVSATGGLFRLGFGGVSTGGVGVGSLTSGSASVTGVLGAAGTATVRGSVGSGKLASGSASVTKLVTGAGSGTVSGATGIGTLTSGSTSVSSLVAATGIGTVTSGSVTVTSVTVSVGVFLVGQPVSGYGIPAGTTVTAVSGSTLTLSKAAVASGIVLVSSEGPAPFLVGEAVSGPGIPAGTTIAGVQAGGLTLSAAATESTSGVLLESGSATVTSVTKSLGVFLAGQRVSGSGISPGTTIAGVSGSTLTLSAPASGVSGVISIVSEGPGPFAVGEAVSGPGIPEGTTVATVTAGGLTLSNPATATGENVVLTVGSETVTSVVSSGGEFVAGQPIAGAGIPPGTTITAVSGSTLRLSNIPTASGVGVAISSAATAVFAVGERIAGTGIPAGATITGVGANTLTLSAPASVSATAVTLTSGIAFDASASEVQTVLDGLASIGGVGGSVSVTGGPGDATGSAPYTVTFEGELADRDVAQLTGDGSLLTGGSQTVTPTTVNQGGGGFSSGAGEAPVGGAELGSAQGDLPVSVALSGLQPDTEYHYRIIATNPTGTVEGPDQTFRTYSLTPAALPDDRAYELVSPVEKDGGEVFPPEPFGGSCGEHCNPGTQNTRMPMQGSPGGDSVVYAGQAFSATGDAVNENEYLSTRTPAGWVTRVLSPALEGRDQAVDGYRAFSPDLSVGVIAQLIPSLSPEAPAGYADLYAQNTVSPATFGPLVGSVPPDRSTGSFKLAFAGASADFSHVLFEANDALTGETAFAPAAQDPGETKNNVYEWVGGSLRLVNVLPGDTQSAPGASIGGTNAVSTDGSRIYWTGPESRVYVRVNGETTLQVPDTGGFLAASPDGSRVLLSDGRLYGLENGAFQLVADLTAGNGGFHGLLGASEDLSHVYFLDSAVLSGEQQNARGQKAQAGQDNLYEWDGGPIVFAATLAGGSTAQVTPDGRYLAFTSLLSLTGYDNHVSSGDCGVGTGSACSEVFLYDSLSARLVCASCDPSGARPLGASSLPASPLAHGAQPHDLTSGGRVFFDSLDALSVHDTNGRVQDVYEYEPSGTGSCESESENGGCLSLISSGRDTTDSFFVDATPSGSDAFFTTRAQLVSEDHDDLVDLYDARENGGFSSDASGPPCTTADSCRTAPVPQPQIFGAPSTQTFTGNGNASPPIGKAPVAQRSLTRAQKLANALRACAKQPKSKRSACRVQARRRYGAKTSSKAKGRRARLTRGKGAGRSRSTGNRRGGK